MAKNIKATSSKSKKAVAKKTATTARKQPVAKQATKKTVAKKVAPKAMKKKSESVKSVQTQPATQLPTFTEVFNKKTILILGAVLLIGLAYSFRGLVIAATVNGLPITRFKIMTEAEKTQGTAILDSLVMDALIEQTAREKGVQISDDEVNAQIEEYRQEMADSGQDFDQILEMQGLSMKELERLVRQQKVVQALIGSEIEITQEQIDEYIEENKDFLPEDMEEEELRQLVEDQLKNQQMSENYQQWSTDLRNNAKIEYFGKYVQEDQALSLQ